ncbi:bifunctional ADP-dependent NAD(P)H-hydrate dehydratase/NAD(P)H-hydrate epimerase [Clostridium sp. KNHs214]|uniref:bifunctional ADP-dependent NAD(P)H-hydrate dehydratase/NAD(P)H-hydrate epimerase n=1 Tax=Clostridium sp. KNHs214 TaxID=1540257 RepID=UPI0005555F66|nr:bifunctional ADP-dependent NAD(P)H-hydrate dehydratase/NAD(P)H-hydrate epimerase [Clostridium sp. KNHs214]
MRIGTSKASREMDRVCIEKIKIPGIVLMENAALKVVKNIDMNEIDSFVLVCGKGNNGGDGFAIARHLHIQGKKVQVFLVGNTEGLTHDCMVNYCIVSNLGITISKINNISDLDYLRNCISTSGMVIDCLFGTGLTRKVEGIYEQVISIINENSPCTLSVDVPSGINSDNGQVMGICVKAHKTVSFQIYKSGFLKYSSSKFIGQVIVENIGIPSKVIEEICPSEFILDKDFIKKTIKVRDKHSNKGDFGRALIISGSEGFTGAAYISAETAVRSGTGLVTLACPKDIQSILSCKLTEAMTVNFTEKEKIQEIVSRAKSIAIGPGMGNSIETLSILEKIIKTSKCPIVVDADAINVLQNHKDLIKEASNTLVFTPHPGEMSRLTALNIEDINENRIAIAKKFALENNVIVLLKGYNTVITDGNSTFINSTGNSAMANGGMGDCLTGLITSFIAQGYTSLEATYLAAYIHGYCGDKLSSKMFCVNAKHIMDYIPYAIKEIIQ